MNRRIGHILSLFGLAALLALAGCTRRDKKAIVVTETKPQDQSQKPPGPGPILPDPGADPGTGPGSDPGSDPGSQPGSGTQPGSDPGSGNPDPSTQPGSQPGTQPGSQPGTQPGSGSGNGGDTTASVTLEMEELDNALGQTTGGATTQPPATTGDATLTANISVETGGSLSLNDINIKPPMGWGIAQKGSVGTSVFAAVSKGEKYVSIYSVPKKGLSPVKIFGHGAEIVTPETTKSVGSHTWKVIETKKTVASGPHKGTWYVYGFIMESGEYTYYGYCRAESADSARSHALEVLEAL